MSLLRVENLKKYFPLRKFGGRLHVRAVDGVSLQVNEGEILGILGESGCGKSTLGLVIGRLERETSGEIYFMDRKISGTMRLNRETRRNIQIIFQNPYDSFDPRLTIGDSLMIPLRINSVGSSDDERRGLILEYLSKAGFDSPRSYMNRYPHELSGGQLQRVSVIRAMMLRPKFLIADECVSMLDVSVRADVINLLMDLVKSSGTSMLFITHDISLGKYVSDRIAVMYLGKIVELGKAKEIVDNPVHPYTKVLVSYSPAVLKKRERIKPKSDITTAVGEMRGCRFAPRCPFSDRGCFETEPQLLKVGEEHWVACLKA